MPNYVIFYLVSLTTSQTFIILYKLKCESSLMAPQSTQIVAISSTTWVEHISLVPPDTKDVPLVPMRLKKG